MRIAFEVLAVGCIVFTLLPFLRYEHWLIRMFDFPRLQILVLATVAITGMLAYYTALTTVQWIIAGITVIAFLFQLSRMLPYTVFGKKRAQDGIAGNGRSVVSIMSANVLMTNSAHHELLALIDGIVILCTELIDSFRYGNAVRQGVPVAIIGAPNSGKSTLLNALLQDDR
ncbi:MAG TPA: 50S ribosome-binding GTPase, partial [Flavobacteriales bacterium]|nr:50S ribosome-binding GTPase [Flavobacteriales bacterium]